MSNTVKTALLIAIIVVAAGVGFWAMKKQSGSSEVVKVYEQETKVLTEEDKAKMRAGWTYDIKSKSWYDENFKPVSKDAKPPTLGQQ